MMDTVGALARLYDDAGLGPVAFPDADDLLVWGGRVLITDLTRASELVFTLAAGMAASFGRAVLVGTPPERVEEWRGLAEQHVPGRVVVLPGDADAVPAGAVAGSAMVH
jgi:hypothetical protein